MTNNYSGQQPTALAENAQPAYYSNQPAGYPAAPGYPPAYPQSVPATDPARTLGIAGLVLSVFTSVVGLIVSIVAFRKSKRAGFKNGAALAGIVVGDQPRQHRPGPRPRHARGERSHLHLRMISRLTFAWVGDLDIEGSDPHGCLGLSWPSSGFARSHS